MMLESFDVHSLQYEILRKFLYCSDECCWSKLVNIDVWVYKNGSKMKEAKGHLI